LKEISMGACQMRVGMDGILSFHIPDHLSRDFVAHVGRIDRRKSTNECQAGNCKPED